MHLRKDDESISARHHFITSSLHHRALRALIIIHNYHRRMAELADGDAFV
jgi:hypothetical protein